MKITVFRDVMPCSLPDIANILEEGGRGKWEEVRKKRRGGEGT
jgi:hypothetical protein